MALSGSVERHTPHVDPEDQVKAMSRQICVELGLDPDTLVPYLEQDGQHPGTHYLRPEEVHDPGFGHPPYKVHHRGYDGQIRGPQWQRFMKHAHLALATQRALHKVFLIES